MTFDSLLSAEFTASFRGDEIVGMFAALSSVEDGLDESQRKALERLRGILYEHLSIEELERLAAARPRGVSL